MAAASFRRMALNNHPLEKLISKGVVIKEEEEGKKKGKIIPHSLN